MSAAPPVALTIAGSDSSGGAGLEMDLKVFSALGVYGACAITAVTAQNSREVRASWEIPAAAVTAQLEAVLDDLRVAAVKTGMLSSEEIVHAVASALRERPFPSVGQGLAPVTPPLIVDPVLAAKDGTDLLSDRGLAVLRDELLPLATLVTPNFPEAAALSGLRVAGEEEAWRAAEKLRALGCEWVLVKGGHLEGQAATDLLLGPDGAQALSSPRLAGGPFHGTGCALSAAITAHLARGLSLPDALQAGRAFLQQLLQTAQSLGKGSLLLHPSAGPVKPEGKRS
jgi:hydroxymethylpyrimidine/phosphomethylpyrimidine kinase